jgi:hypothetical protein
MFLTEVVTKIKYSITTLNWIVWGREPSGYAENMDNWI